MSNPPSGIVTFLFTDIEGSTKLWQEQPEQMKSNLARHDALLRAAIENNRGSVFKTVGDAFCAAFAEPLQGVRAAIEAQAALAREAWGTTPVRVRIGLHTGEAEFNGQDYRGYLTLSLAQRVMAAGHGGQILLSGATEALVCERIPAEVSLRDMGEHQLKGLLAPEHLWQVVADGLAQDFPPLQTLSNIPNNLPATLNRFVGRAHELKEVKERLKETRLLTLLGPGGTGKTRLAVQAATELLPDYEDRVYMVDLAPSREAASALSAIARTLGLREKSDQPLLEDLKKEIKRRKMLLLLDNFEQVTVAAAPMAELLRDCPELKLLVTSREALHVRGENVYPIPPLKLPQAQARHPTLESLTECEAIQLFIERAQAVRPDFELNDENAQAVVEICVHLDGLPLAIELATARLNVFSPQALAERLGNRLKLLRGGARDLPERQQTLHATIDWSYEILDEGEKRLFECLAVFDGVSFEAIEDVAERIPQLKELNQDIFERVGSLANKSLIRQADGANDLARLRMLETIREYAAARLDENMEFSAAVRQAHAAYFADLTQAQWVHLTSDGREAALKRLAADLENIQAAWRYWVEQGELEQLGKFTNCLWMLYDARGWYHATVQLTTDLLKVLRATASTPERAEQEILLQTTLARALTTTQGYTLEVEQAYARALELCDSVGEIPQLFPVLRGLSYFYVYLTQFDKGIQMGERILKLAEHLNDADMKMEGQMLLGYSLAFDHDLAGGLELLEQSIAGYDITRQRVRRLGLGANPGVVSLTASGLCLWMAGQPERGRKRVGEAVALARKLEHPFSLAYGLFHFGLINLWLGKPSTSQETARALIDLADEHQFLIWSAVGACLRGRALVELGSSEAGLAMLERGMQAAHSENTPPIFGPSLLYLQAEACLMAGRPAEGMPHLDEALQIGMSRAGRLAAPEFFGLKGDLLLALDPTNAAEAEKWYRMAVDTAIEVRAAMLELRAAVKLGKLWISSGRRAEAREVVKAAYGKINAGFETVDMRQAREVLEE
jgi:predicted ATPase/class 3 adenylate cyclase